MLNPLAYFVFDYDVVGLLVVVILIVVLALVVRKL
jgi:hypothetical protein